MLLAAFVALAHMIPSRGGTRADVAIANALGNLSTHTGDIVFTWISWLGDTALSGFLVAAVAALIYHRRWPAAATTIIASLGGMMLNETLKTIYHRPRPDYAIDLIAGYSSSFPSGHSMASIIGFGVLAYFRRELETNVRRRHAIIAAAAIIIVAVGFSRLYLGVHYATDVVGGFLAGATWLAICIESYRASRSLSHKPEHEAELAPQ